MADTAFTAYTFKADVAETNQVARTLPARLSDSIINVKDWGATGNGTTDDTNAIVAALAFAYNVPAHTNTHTAVVYFPPGTYAIGNPGGVPTRLQLYGTVIGSGRDVTILTGNFSSGTLSPAHFDGNGWVTDSPRFLCWSDVDRLDYLADLTIRNDSSVAGSGAYFSAGTSGGLNPAINNVHFHGYVGANIWTGQFGIDITNCLFTCSVPITRADDANLHPLVTGAEFLFNGDVSGTIGLYAAIGTVINCRAEGFDIGFVFGNSGGPSVVGNKAYRCHIPFYLGGIKRSAATSGQIMNGGCVQGNIAERCLGGFYLGRTSVTSITNNILASGTMGPYDPAPILDMQYNGTTHVVTVQTSTAHNITSPARIRLFVEPPEWVPSTSGFVTTAAVDSTHFSYPGPLSPPATFSSGNWNYAVETGLSGYICSAVFLAANTTTTPYDIGIAVPHATVGTAAGPGNIAMSMLGPGGWSLPAHNEFPDQWEIIMCGKGGSNPPISRMRFSSLPTGVISSTQPQGPFDGQTFNIVDGQKSGGGTAAFGDIVTGGSTGRYKVRYETGTNNWRRVG